MWWKLSRSVTKILTLCKIHDFFLNTAWKLKSRAFQRCTLRGSQHLLEVSQNKDFLQKTAWKKTVFLVSQFRINWLWRGLGPPIFQSLSIFQMLPENLRVLFLVLWQETRKRICFHPISGFKVKTKNQDGNYMLQNVPKVNNGGF